MSRNERARAPRARRAHHIITRQSLRAIPEPRATTNIASHYEMVCCSERPRCVTLYAVRHGEAIHNIREKQAKNECEAAILAENSRCSKEEVSEAKEAFRQVALHDPNLHDAPLSDAGKAGALEVREIIQMLVTSGLPKPTLVLTSPLQRALQTTALLFPGHNQVRVREELRERRTGLPCDERSSAREMSRRGSFRNMRFSQVPKRATSRRTSIIKLAKEVLGAGRTMSPSQRDSNADEEVEQKADVRKRSEQLFALLGRYRKHGAVAIVTHKGWLREFERGPLGRIHAAEFGNLEVRVFTLQLGPGGQVHVARRHPPEEGHLAEEQRA